MKTIKVMSIIGISLFTLSMICLVAFVGIEDYEGAAGCGMMAIFYALPLSIVTLITSFKTGKRSDSDSYDELLKLHSMIDTGILSEEEFNARKQKLLK